MKSLTNTLNELNKYGNIIISADVHGVLWRDYAEQVINIAGRISIKAEWEKDYVIIRSIRKKTV